ncbi:MAG: sulfotransferase domain-containing protein [Rubrobacter sp.]|nr:sulfotransferase domain-containing protein [Rubrobacter sp.]MBA3790645.1 sulfotransferase domain-containing protein [Rubrobacter sp.]
MPVFRNFMDFQVLRGIRAFLDVEAGLVRGMVPERDTGRKGGREASEREISRLRKELAETNEELAGLKNAGSSTDGRRESFPVFFVVGWPKSGTTWVQGMLNQHPEVLCRGEGKFFGRDDRNETFEKVPVNARGQMLRPGSLYNILAESEDLRIWLERTWWTREGDAEEQISLLVREAALGFLGRELSKTNKKIVGDKTPFAGAETVREIGGILPEAKVIHVVRDGRDVAVSHTHHRWNRVRPVEEGGRLTPEERDKRDRYREDPEKFLASGESIFSEEYITSAAKAWRSQIGGAHRDGPLLLGENYAEVRYEDLLERPEEEMRRLFRLIGARDDGGVVRRCVEKRSFESITRRPAGDEDSASFFRKGVAGDWRSVFTERDRRIYGEIAGDLLAELGYDRDKG